MATKLLGEEKTIIWVKAEPKSGAMVWPVYAPVEETSASQSQHSRVGLGEGETITRNRKLPTS